MKHIIYSSFFFLLFLPSIAFGQVPDLGASATFALFTAAGAFNGDAATSITGDIGTNVGAFTPPGFLNGSIQIANPATAQAAADVSIAYGYLAGLTCGSVLTTPLGNSQILGPNIYCIGTAAVLNADLILDGGGDPGAVFIFQIDGALSTNSFSNVLLTNGANLCNVYWQINGALNVGGNTFFQGTVIAAGAINLGNGATLSGRGLSTAGAISTSANVVTLSNACLCMLDVSCPNPSGGTFQCIDDIPAVALTDVVVNSACGVATVAITETSSGIGCAAAPYVLVRTYTVTDDGGFTVVCEVSFTVIDNIAPLISCPTAVAFVECSTTPTFPTATATDLCDDTPTITFLDDLTPGGLCPQEYSVTRTWTATDDCGNTAQCNQTVFVTDNTAPVITCPTVTASIECSEVANFLVATATDLCDAMPTVTFVDVQTPGGICPQEYNLTRIWTATDDCGNASMCERTILVTDNTAPTIICPTVTATVECPAVPIFPAAATATDLCDATPIITFADVTTPGGLCLQEYGVTRTWTATDDCGNSSVCERTISVTDNTAPIIICPTVIATIECPAVPTFPAAATATDLCDVTPTITFADVSTPSNICLQEYSVTRTWTATDDCGNASMCNRTISVIDDTAPVFINPPVNITVECFNIPPIIALPVATDNCSAIVTVVLISEVQLPGICPTLYTLTRIWRATDECGNSSFTSQVITVVDTYAPQFVNFPENIVLDCDLATNEAAFQDWLDSFGGATVFECSLITWTTIPSPFFTMPSLCGGTSQRFIRFIATDACGNSAFQDASFTIMDMTPPVFNVLPQNLHLECVAGDQGEAQLPDWLDNFGGAEVSDACGEVVTEVVLLSNLQGCGNTFTRTYQFRATDECGNTNYVTATFAVVDTTPPVIVTCPQGNVLLTCEFDIPMPDTAGVIAWDACGAVKITVQDIFSYGVGCVYWPLTTAYTYAVTDECGNVSTCYQSFQVVDSIAPVYNGLDTIEVLCVTDLPGLGEVPDLLAPFLTDNCYEVICVNEGMATNGPTWVTYCVKVKDLCGNWTDKFFITFIATGGCKPLCAEPQTVWGDTGGAINGMGTSAAIDQLITKYGPLKAGKLGKTISVNSSACLQNMLPGNGGTAPFNPGTYVFGTTNECQPVSPLLNPNGTLNNKVASNVLTLQLNIWYNLEFNERDLRVQLLASLPSCLVDPVVLSKLEEHHFNVQGLLNLSNDYLAGVGFYPTNFGSPLNSALENLNQYWQNCQINDPCSNTISVAGSLKTESLDGLEGAKLRIDVSNQVGPLPSLFAITELDGSFEFSNAIPLAGNFSITPSSENLAPLNGVTTYDLVLISRHILGWEPFASPYNMIAADANKSGSITTMDILELRKLILGIYDELPNNTSWRFVDKSFVFSNPFNPFEDTFPELKVVENNLNNQMAEDFVGVKIGDVNASAVANGLMFGTERDAENLLFDVYDRQVQSGETFEVRLMANQIVQGYQFAFNTGSLEVLEVSGMGMNAGNFAVFAENKALTVSWNAPEGLDPVLAELSIKFSATQTGRLSEMLGLSSRFTKAEAYRILGGNTPKPMGVALRFQDKDGATMSSLGFELYQNVPNPFVDNTSIGFYLPDATEATLSVFDETGRLLYTQTGDFDKGYNVFTIVQSLTNNSGALFYKLVTTTDTATRMMIQAK